MYTDRCASDRTNDVYVVEQEGAQQLLLPAIKDCIRDIDMEQMVMTVYLMPGLRN